ncbi:MAG: hypothetical protein ABW352_24375 [Polyangiales bacterium]
MSRILAYGFGLGLVALVAAPGFGDPTDDSYPLSTYPMFARPRGKPTLSFVEGVTEAAALRLPPEIVAHNEIMQAVATVKRAVMAGPEAMDRLCTRIAADVASDAAYAPVREVRIVSARFDPIRYFTEGPEPEERHEHFRCPVRR